MADRRVLLQEKKYIDLVDSGKNLILDGLEVGLRLSNISEVQNFRTSRM